MIASNIEFIKIEDTFTFWTFNNFFNEATLLGLEQSIQEYDYKLTEGDRTKTSGPRIWCHKANNSLKLVSAYFANINTKQYFSDLINFDLTNLKTRVELCRDDVGSWLQPHCDDSAKHFTLQIYLSNGAKSTVLGNRVDQTKQNAGWLFKNTGTELHELPPLSSKRTSLIINYVDNFWNNKDVLVEG